MPTSQNVHLELATFLQNTGIRLSMVARLFDDALAMPDDQDVEKVRIFIPDLHVISKSRQVVYPGYGFHANPQREEIMVNLLRAIGSFARQLPRVTMLEIYQLGDFVDLWRESFSNDPSEIIADNAPVCDLLLRGLRTSPTDSPIPIYCLRGNHDFTIMDWSYFSSWQRAYFFDDNSMAVLHGDVLDWVEAWPDWPRRAIVYLTGVRSGETNFSQKELEKGTNAIHQTNETAGRYAWTNEYWLGKQLPPIPESPTGPVDENVIKADDFSGHELMANACELADQLLSTRQIRTRLMIIGHTHHPRIVRYQKDNELFVLMDCGAWLENYWVGPDPDTKPSVTFHSQQIGVVIGNDLRIYQVD